MPTQEQLRKEQDPFQKLESAPPAVDQALQTAPEKRAADADHRAAEAERSEREKPAPGVLAEVPQQGGASDEVVSRLYNHFTDKKQPEKSADEKQRSPVASEARRGRKDRVPQQRSPGDEYQTGMAADFVPNTKVVVGELDIPPTGGKRRRRGAPFDSQPETQSEPGPLGPAPEKKSE